MGFEFNVLYRGFKDGLFEPAGLPGRKDRQKSAITMTIEAQRLKVKLWAVVRKQPCNG